MYEIKGKRIFVAGHRGMVGSAVIRALQRAGVEGEGSGQLLTRSSEQLDLRDQAAVNDFFASQQPQVVIFAAAKVGGIHANHAYPVEFLYDNLVMAANAIHAAFQHEADRFLFLGSTCIYPRMARQPMTEDCLLTGALEPTNEAYALAKISGLKLCEYYRRQYGATFYSAMPTNLYGPGDNYHPENSHVLPALIRRLHEARESGQDEVIVWGSGKPRREFLHVDDLASALLHLLGLDQPPDLVNVGTGSDVTIRQLAELVAAVVGYEGKITQDTSKPDGTPVKRTDTRLMESTGWRPRITLDEGVRRTYEDFLRETQASLMREH